MESFWDDGDEIEVMEEWPFVKAIIWPVLQAEYEHEFGWHDFGITKLAEYKHEFDLIINSFGHHNIPNRHERLMTIRI